MPTAQLCGDETTFAFTEASNVISMIEAEIATLQHQGCSGGDFDPCECVTKPASFHEGLRQAEELTKLLTWMKKNLPRVPRPPAETSLSFFDAEHYLDVI